MLSVALVAAAALSVSASADDGAPQDAPAGKGETRYRPASTLGLPPVLDPATNPSTPGKVELGRRLFADTRLSTDGTVSCATCHAADKSFTDGRQVALGVEGRLGHRNAPTLWNAALLPRLFWDGRAPSLEEQARQPFLNVDEYGWDDEGKLLEHVASFDEYPPLFEAAFGDKGVTLQRMARAIATYERTLVGGASPFDRWWAGVDDALDEPARRGYDLFIGKANCVQCHPIRQSYALFTDGVFHNTGAGKGKGLEDAGRMDVTGKPEDRGAFRTPTLRNVALTAPYMHDGSLATLEEVVKFYVDGGVANPNLSELIIRVDLSPEEQKDLIAFLHALTSPVRAHEHGYETCERLLAEGRDAEAYDAFLASLDGAADPLRVASGLTSAALRLYEPRKLLRAERALREALHDASPGHGRDAAPEVARALLLLARVSAAIAPHEEAMGLARQEDALIALDRIRTAGVVDPEALAFEARLLDTMDRKDDAIALLDAALDGRPELTDLRVARANLRFRRGWVKFVNGSPDDDARADLAATAAEFAQLAAGGHALADADALTRAYALHWLGETGPARAAYRDAAVREPVAEKALQGLRNLLAGDLAAYRDDLASLLTAHPESPALVYFRAYEDLLTGHTDAAERGFRRRMELEDAPTGGPHRYLGRILAGRGERTAALDQYAVALALSPGDAALITEYDTYLRERQLSSFADVDALIAEYRQYLDAGPDDPRFQVVGRNNLAFRVRDVVTSFASRGPARIHTLPEGAPPDVLRLAKEAVALYEEAVALIPDDVADRPFAERWIYAGVHNDTGLMYHYFRPLQDLEKAERHYLQAFELTGGAYMDAYYYNLQFLYGFELEGRAARWLELARVAKDAILREDPESPTGFSPDTFKRTAARRDFERLSGHVR